jgi:hypothetical protein
MIHLPSFPHYDIRNAARVIIFMPMHPLPLLHVWCIEFYRFLAAAGIRLEWRKPSKGKCNVIPPYFEYSTIPFLTLALSSGKNLLLLTSKASSTSSLQKMRMDWLSLALWPLGFPPP